MRKKIFKILLPAVLISLIFSCKKQESPVDFAVTSVEFSYEISPAVEGDTIESATVKLISLAESHPDYDGDIEDYSDKSFWKISLFKTSSFPEITGEEISFNTTEGTSAVYSHTFDFVTGDEITLDVVGKWEVMYASDLKKVYKIARTDSLNHTQPAPLPGGE